MTATQTYYVKPNPGLFRKTRWTVLFHTQKVGERDTQAEALELAIEQARRSADLGRQVEIWANNGEGFVLFKSFQPAQKKKGKEDEDEDEGEESREVGDPMISEIPII